MFPYSINPGIIFDIDQSESHQNRASEPIRDRLINELNINENGDSWKPSLFLVHNIHLFYKTLSFSYKINLDAANALRCTFWLLSDAENREKYWRLGQFVKKLQYTLMLYPVISFIPVPYIEALPSLQWIQSWPKGYWEPINLVDGKGENLFLIKTGTLYRYVRQLFTRCTKRWILSMFFAVCDCIHVPVHDQCFSTDHVLSRITLTRARRVVPNWRFSNSHSV